MNRPSRWPAPPAVAPRPAVALHFLLVITMLAACSAGATAPGPAGGGSTPLSGPTMVPASDGPSPGVTVGPPWTALPPATEPAAPEPSSSGSIPAPAVLVGAGDIGECGSGGPAATAAVVRRVLDDYPDAVAFTAGDDAYPDGTAADFARCYDPWWGAFRDRTRPAAGNHEWHTPGAAGYLAYYGTRAGTEGRTWYAYDAGSWRVIVLDSDCEEVGGCGPSSPQGRWLADELAAHPTACALAVWHHPRFSSGPHGNQAAVAPLFDALYVAGADLVVNGHDHDYERFAPQDPAGRADAALGIREFVVGTGGSHLYPTLFPRANSEVRSSAGFGVLVLELGEGGYAWRFEAAGDSTFSDAGTGACH